MKAGVIAASHHGSRSLSAANTFHAGHTILLDHPVVMAPTQIDNSVCIHCLRWRHPDLSSLVLCSRCGEEETSFCSAACHQEYAIQHENECALINPLLEKLFSCPLVPLHDALMVMRLLILLELGLPVKEKKLLILTVRDLKVRPG